MTHDDLTLPGQAAPLGYRRVDTDAQSSSATRRGVVRRVGRGRWGIQ